MNVGYSIKHVLRSNATGLVFKMVYISKCKLGFEVLVVAFMFQGRHRRVVAKGFLLLFHSISLRTISLSPNRQLIGRSKSSDRNLTYCHVVSYVLPY